MNLSFCKYEQPDSHVDLLALILNLTSKRTQLCTNLASVLAPWAGRIALAKMYLLPHILYVFRALPMPFFATHFKMLQAILASHAPV